MAESLSPILEQPVQDTGSNPNIWGDVLNGIILNIERAIAGYADVDLTLGDVTLTVAQALPRTLYFIGSPDKDRVVTLPSKSKDWTVVDLTTGGKKITLKTATDGGVTIPKGATSQVNSRGGKLYGGLGRVLDGTGGVAAGASNAVLDLSTGDGIVGPGGVIALTDDQAASGILIFRGAQTQNIIVTVPEKRQRWSVVNLLVNPQPAPGQGTGAIGTISNGQMTGRSYPAAVFSAEARQAFGVTVNSSGDPVSGPFYHADVIGLISNGSFLCAGALSTIDPNGGSANLYNEGFRQVAGGQVTDGSSGSGKGTFLLLVDANGVQTIRFTERGGWTMTVNLSTGAYTWNYPDNFSPPAVAPAAAITFVQATAIQLFNVIAAGEGGDPGTVPPDPTPAFTFVIKTTVQGGKGVQVESSTCVEVVTDGIDCFGGAGQEGTSAAANYAPGLPPIGSIVYGAGKVAPDPRVRWLECVGQTLSATQYPDLFAAIGTVWGGGGAGSFKLPDLRNYFLRVYTGGTASIGAKAADTIRSHTHSGVVANGGAHTHFGSTGAGGAATVNLYQRLYNIDGNKAGNANGEDIQTTVPGGPYSTIPIALPNHTHTVTIDVGGTHGHTVAIAATGGVETAPMHARVKVWIRVR